MKFSLIAAGLILCSCATGVADPIDEPVEVYVAPPNLKPKPPPVTFDDTDAAPPIKCVIDSYWVNDCFVVKIYCEDKPTKTEISCGPGRPLWPWEIIPDPPYDNRK